MSNGGRWVNGQWVEYKNFDEVMKDFIAQNKAAPVRPKPLKLPRIKVHGISPAEYRRRHLGKRRGA